MDEKKPFPLPPRNPHTHANHRREVLLQVTLPLLITILLLVAAVLGVNLGDNTQVHRWANASLILLLIPVLFFSLLFLAILAMLVYAISRLLGILPPYARLTQDLFSQMEFKVKKAADAAVEPALRLHAAKAGWQAFTRRGQKTPPRQPGVATTADSGLARTSPSQEE